MILKIIHGSKDWYVNILKISMSRYYSKIQFDMIVF